METDDMGAAIEVIRSFELSLFDADALLECAVLDYASLGDVSKLREELHPIVKKEWQDYKKRLANYQLQENVRKGKEKSKEVLMSVSSAFSGFGGRLHDLGASLSSVSHDVMDKAEKSHLPDRLKQASAKAASSWFSSASSLLSLAAAVLDDPPSEASAKVVPRGGAAQPHDGEGVSGLQASESSAAQSQLPVGAADHAADLGGILRAARPPFDDYDDDDGEPVIPLVGRDLKATGAAAARSQQSEHDAHRGAAAREMTGRTPAAAKEITVPAPAAAREITGPAAVGEVTGPTPHSPAPTQAPGSDSGVPSQGAQCGGDGGARPHEGGVLSGAISPNRPQETRPETGVQSQGAQRGGQGAAPPEGHGRQDAGINAQVAAPAPEPLQGPAAALADHAFEAVTHLSSHSPPFLGGGRTLIASMAPATPLTHKEVVSEVPQTSTPTSTLAPPSQQLSNQAAASTSSAGKSEAVEGGSGVAGLAPGIEHSNAAGCGSGEENVLGVDGGIAGGKDLQGGEEGQVRPATLGPSGALGPSAAQAAPTSAPSGALGPSAAHSAAPAAPTKAPSDALGPSAAPTKDPTGADLAAPTGSALAAPTSAAQVASTTLSVASKDDKDKGKAKETVLDELDALDEQLNLFVGSDTQASYSGGGAMSKDLEDDFEKMLAELDQV